MQRSLYEESHELFRASFRTFVEREIAPHHQAWERAGIVDRSLYRRAGDAGFLGMA
ncbi:MAG: acyl-CoA dehydrogenase family protein, partial [Actinomycetota bacterium]